MKKMILGSILLLLVMISGLSTVYGQENLLINGDFEKLTPDGNIEGWIPDFWQPGATITPTTVKVYNGKYALLIKADTSNDARLMQTVRVKPKTHYRFSGWIYGENIPEAKTGANLCIMGGYDYTEAPKGTSGWTRVELNFRTGSTQNEVTVAARLGMYTNDNTGTAYFDDLRLEELETTPPTYSQLDGPETEEKPTDSTAPKTGGKLNGGLLLLGALIVLLGVNLFFYIRSKKKTNSETTVDTTVETTGDTTEDTKG